MVYDNSIDKILDDNNFDNIVLYDDDGKAMEFEQIALIPLNEKQYAILRPVRKNAPVKNEGIAFEVNAENGLLSVVDNQKVVDRLFAEYLKMLNEN